MKRKSKIARYANLVMIVTAVLAILALISISISKFLFMVMIGLIAWGVKYIDTNTSVFEGLDAYLDD